MLGVLGPTNHLQSMSSGGTGVPSGLLGMRVQSDGVLGAVALLVRDAGEMNLTVEQVVIRDQPRCGPDGEDIWPRIVVFDVPMNLLVQRVVASFREALRANGCVVEELVFRPGMNSHGTSTVWPRLVRRESPRGYVSREEVTRDGHPDNHASSEAQEPGDRIHEASYVTPAAFSSEATPSQALLESKDTIPALKDVARVQTTSLDSSSRAAAQAAAVPASGAKRFWSTVMESEEDAQDSESPAGERAEESSVDAQEKPFPCGLCSSRFKRKRNLAEHVTLVHEKQRPYPCPTCDVRFGKRSNLTKHIQLVHEKQRPYLCDICGTHFGQRSNLLSHIRTVHNREKPFSCETCGMVFGQKSALRMHIRAVHNKERPYLCDHCGNSFGHKGDLNRHVRVVHEKEKPFQCSLCKSDFGRKSVLDKHLSSVHGIISSPDKESEETDL